MKLSLLIAVPGNTQGKVIPVSRFPFLIGRDGKCQLRPSSAIVSNRHCGLDVRDGKAYLLDLKSTNGTFLNGQRVQTETELHNGDRVQVGPLSFEIRLEGSVPVDQPTPLPPSKAPSKPVEEDDSIAAVLLSMPDEGGTASSGATTLDATGIPTGGTEVLRAPTDPAAAGTEANQPAEKKDAKQEKADKAKAAAKTTAIVAEELLKKYLRRPRASKE